MKNKSFSTQYFLIPFDFTSLISRMFSLYLFTSPTSSNSFLLTEFQIPSPMLCTVLGVSFWLKGNKSVRFQVCESIIFFPEWLVRQERPRVPRCSWPPEIHRRKGGCEDMRKQNLDVMESFDKGGRKNQELVLKQICCSLGLWNRIC